MKRFTFLLLFCCLCFSSLFSLSLKNKILHGEEGDFIVALMDKNYSILALRSLNKDRIILEEITIPENQVQLPFDWHKWVETDAPGNTSWSMYEIDLKQNLLVESFSFTKKAWLYFEEQDDLISKLFTLTLTPIPNDVKRRIGSALTGDLDRRRFWYPPLVFDGKKKSKAQFETLQGIWPQDGTPLAGQRIEFYFDLDSPFPFPYWMQVAHNHYGFKVMAIDSGKKLSSPQPLLPHRPPLFFSKLQKSGDDYRLILKSPIYYKSIQLFAIDMTTENKQSVSVPTKAQKRGSNELLFLELSKEDLNKVLQSGHQYQWLIIPEGEAHISVQSEDFFVWL